MHDPAVERSLFVGLEDGLGRGDVAGAARLQLVSGVVQLRREDAMVEALFKGWRALQTAQLTERLRELGLSPAQSRSTALFQLATELPAAILARMLGIHISVAAAWQRASAGDWTTYAADVSRRGSALGTPAGPP